ncbi:MAG: cupin domain-containing protein [Candidatus Odyssella sp.]|nr:cupin domain-containing protein [Candidatus Odyssella sp.]
MQIPKETIVLAAGAGPVVDVLGAPAVYKATSADTGGRFSVFEQSIPVGYGVPPHRHEAEDEAMYVLAGDIAIDGEAGAHRIGAGGFVFLPRGRFHSFRNAGGTPARALVICTPGAALERCFEAFAAAGARGALAPEMLTAIAAGHGVEIARPPE